MFNITKLGEMGVSERKLELESRQLSSKLGKGGDLTEGFRRGNERRRLASVKSTRISGREV